MSHDPSDIILICSFGAQETDLIIDVKNRCAVYYFHETIIIYIYIFFFFSGILINRIRKIYIHFLRAVQLIACYSHAHLVSKAGSVFGNKSPSRFQMER